LSTITSTHPNYKRRQSREERTQESDPDRDRDLRELVSTKPQTLRQDAKLWLQDFVGLPRAFFLACTLETAFFAHQLILNAADDDLTTKESLIGLVAVSILAWTASFVVFAMLKVLAMEAMSFFRREKVRRIHRSL
jgi:hypothetical protein